MTGSPTCKGRLAQIFHQIDFGAAGDKSAIIVIFCLMRHRGNPPQSGRDNVARVQGREAAAAPGYVQTYEATRGKRYIVRELEPRRRT